MKRLLFFLLVLLSMSTTYSQSRYYLRADSVFIEKGGGNGELIIRNGTRDSTGGLMVNIGGGRTAFIKTKKLTDSSFVVGTDTITIRTGTTLTNAGGAGDTLLTADGKIKRLDHDATLTFSTNGSKILMGADTINYLVSIPRLRDTEAAIRDDFPTPGGTNTQVQFNDFGAFGANPGFTYDKTQHKVTTDSLLLNKHLRFLGNSIDAATRAAIQFGDKDNPFVTDTATGSTTGTMMLIYPKFSCDTCGRNQPFHIKVGTQEQTSPWKPDIAMQWGFGDGSFARSLGYLQLEQSFFDQSEFYFEYKPENSGERVRPFAYNMILSDTNGYVQGIHTEDQAIFHAGNNQDQWQYGSLSANNIALTPYVNADGTSTMIDLRIKDSTTPAAIRGGLKMTSQNSSGSYLSTYELAGDQININTSAGWLATSSGTGASSSAGRHYIFNITGTGKPLWVGKNWGSTYDQAFEVQNNLNTIFAPQNTSDEGSKVQIWGTGDDALYVRSESSSTDDVSYPIRIVHTTSGTAEVGFATGLKLQAENGSNAVRDLVSIDGVYTDATNTSEDADLVMKTIRSGSLTEGARMTSAGQWKLGAYGSGSFTGTVAKYLAVTSSGDVIEADGAGSSADSSTFSTNYRRDTAIANVRGEVDSLASQELNFYNADGSGDTLLVGVSPTELYVKNVEVTGPGITKDITDSTVRYITPGNMINADLSQTANRLHKLNKHNFQIDSAAFFSITNASNVGFSSNGTFSGIKYITSENVGSTGGFTVDHSTRNSADNADSIQSFIHADRTAVDLYAGRNAGNQGRIAISTSPDSTFIRILSAQNKVEISAKPMAAADSILAIGPMDPTWKTNPVYKIPYPAGGSGATISDAAYGAGWDGNTTDGASKNALYDKISTLTSLTGAETLTNKRITARVTTTVSSSTPTPDADASDMYTVTALAANATFGAPIGTPTDGQALLVRIKDNGTARTLSWNAIYRAGSDFALPTTTVISKTIYVQLVYNAADSKWDAVGLTQGF